MRIHGVNGIWTKPGGDNHTTDRMLKALREEGYSTRDVNYPKMTALLSYSKRLEVLHAQTLWGTSKPEDVVIAHSRGGLVTWRACMIGAKFKTIILFAPAMGDKVEWPEDCADKIYVIHDPRDHALGLGRLLPFHRFGVLGKFGYRGKPDERIININAQEIIGETKDYEYDFLMHSHYFMNVPIWKEKVIQCISLENNSSLP